MATRRAIDELFLHPPLNDGDLRRRLGRLNVREARQLLVARLSQGSVRESDGQLFRAALALVGLGEERERLIEIALDARRTASQRGHALAVLDEANPGAVAQLATRLPPEEMLALGDIPMIDLLVQILAEPEEAEQLYELLSEAPESLREVVFDRMEQCRLRVGTPAVLTYGDMLSHHPGPSLRARALAPIVAEGGDSAVALLDRLRLAAETPEERRELNGALMRVRTAMIDGRADAGSEGFGYLGSCDGQGAFILFGCFASIDDTFTRVDLCIRAAGEIRDGSVYPRTTQQEIEEGVADFTAHAGTTFVRIPLASAAAIVRAARVREDREEDASSSTGPGLAVALALFHQLSSPMAEVADFVEAPAADAGEEFTRERLREVLALPLYESWFFDAGDLGPAGPPPGRKGAWKKWLASATAAVDRPEVRQRVLSMARHMARWHAYKGDLPTARLFSAAAADCERAFAKSALVEVLIEHSREALADGPEFGEHVGSPPLREHLKLLFFQEVDRPRGRDLGHLDFTEAAYQVLSSALALIPGERRPGDDRVAALAYTIGSRVADFFMSGRSAPIAEMMVSLADELARSTDLEAAECRTILSQMILPALGDFAEQVCARCPVGCLDAPRRAAAEAFFSPRHPAAGPPH
ncbi:MAG TPA: hypothetical protein VH877_33935 [Polyangia bacterium]|nr:hypothetical protein [Polyangia bacterium]